MKRETFVFYKSWAESAKCLPNDARLMLYDAITSYAFDGTYNNDNVYLDALMACIKAKIDDDKEKFEETSRRRSEAGRKGGAPKGNNNASKNKQSDSKQANDCFVKQKQAKQAKQAENENENENENVLNLNNLDKQDCMSETKVSDLPKSPFPKDISEVCEFFNSEVVRLKSNIAPFYRIKSESQCHQIIRARLNEYGMDETKKCITKALSSDFLNARTGDAKWMADNNWIFRPNNFQKIMNGAYDNRCNTSRSGYESQLQSIADEVATSAKGGW